MNKPIFLTRKQGLLVAAETKKIFRKTFAHFK